MSPLILRAIPRAIPREIRRAVLLLPLVLFAAAACNKADEPTSPTAPTTAVTITEPTVTGTLTRNGALTYAFVANTGTITASITALTPEDAVVGLALGEWNNTTELCQLRLTSDAAAKGKLLVGSAQTSALYCVRIYDASGQLTAPVAFDISVVHF